jgi:hypothetical protein
MITNVLHGFHLHVLELETFINIGLGELITNSLYGANETSHLIFVQILKHEDNHHELVSLNFQCVDGHFLHRVFIFVLDEKELYQGLLSRHEPCPQVNTLFDKFQIPSFASREKWLSPKYSPIIFFSNGVVYLHIKKILEI